MTTAEVVAAMVREFEANSNPNAPEKTTLKWRRDHYETAADNRALEEVEAAEHNSFPQIVCPLYRPSSSERSRSQSTCICITISRQVAAKRTERFVGRRPEVAASGAAQMNCRCCGSLRPATMANLFPRCPRDTITLRHGQVMILLVAEQKQQSNATNNSKRLSALALSGEMRTAAPVELNLTRAQLGSGVSQRRRELRRDSSWA